VRRLLPLVLLAAIGCQTGGDPVEVVIPRGLSTAGIADTLLAHGVIDNPGKFRLLARVLGFEKRLRFGRYRLRANTEELFVLEALARELPAAIRVTIPEGYRLTQIARALEENAICPAVEFEAACRDRSLLELLGIPGRSAEGYLFPDTYEFETGSAPADVIERMAGRFREVYGGLRADAAPPLDDSQTVILASILEREVVRREELATVAGVFVNRLRRGFPLQSCATVQYALPAYKEKLSVEDTRVDSPYNTYLRPGLPPGPISNPGREALKAALSPQRTDYLYFVAEGDGSHTFSRTLREHEAAKRRARQGG